MNLRDASTLELARSEVESKASRFDTGFSQANLHYYSQVLKHHHNLQQCTKV